jgi:hypothetical protein
MSGGDTMKIPPAKKLDMNVSITLMSSPALDKSIERSSDEFLMEQLNYKAKRYLEEGRRQGTYRCFEYEVINVSGKVVENISSYLKVPRYTEKLFEGAYIKNVDASVARYIFGTIVGYCNFFSSPIIIIRDYTGSVVDITKYRPFHQGYENLPKYLYEKSVNKPQNRGSDFLYVFQREMERLISKYRYVFVGEGLKNAINALIRSVPYISIESTSNVKNQKISEYIQNLYQSGIRVYGAMDGDKAGKTAFDTMNGLLERSIENLIDFESDMDFTDYLRKEEL